MSSVRFHSDGRGSWRADRATTRAALCAFAAVLLVALVAPAAALGATWSAQRSGTTQSLQAVDFATAQNGWAVGNVGTIVATADGGATWVAQASGTLETLTDVDFVDAAHGWIVGQNGTILATSNGGATWVKQTFPLITQFPTTGHLTAVRFLDTLRGWAVGPAGALIYTTNGGVTWTREALPYGPDISVTTNWTDIAMADATHGWIVGQNEVAYAPAPPTAIDNPPFGHLSLGTAIMLRAVDFTSATHAWTVGDAGKIFVTADGSTWTEQPSDTKQGLVDVVALDALNVWALSGQGTVLASADGGTSWQAMTIALPYGFNDMAMVDAGHGWIVGGRGIVYAYGENGAKPVPKALRNATVKKGKVAKLRYRVDYPAGTCSAKIKIVRKGKTIKTLVVNNATVNKDLVKSFTCKLKKGTYTWSVTAEDPAGTASLGKSSKKLFVK